MTPVTPAAPSGAAPVSRAAAPARLSAVAALVVAVVGSMLGLSGNLDGLLGSGGVTVIRGVVEMATGEGQWAVAPVGVPLPSNARLRAPTGTASLGVPDGAVHLAEGTEVVLARPMQVHAGSVLVDSTTDYDVAAGVVSISGRGIWRIDGGGPARVATYRGSTLVTDAAGRESVVRPLEELRLRDAVTDGVPRPYVYTATDPFDPSLLADAFAVDEFVAALHRGLETEFGDLPQEPGFFTDFDGLDGGLVARLGDVGFTFVGDRIGPPADVLVAAVVTEALVIGAGLSADEAAGRVRDLRLAGATWGLITARHDVSASDVRAAAERALERRRTEVQQGRGTPVLLPGNRPAPGDGTPDGAAPLPGPTDGATDPTNGDGGGSDQPDGPGSPGDEPQQPPPADGTGSSGPVGTVVDVVDDVVPVGDLVGDEGEQLIDDTVTLVDDLIQGTTDTLDATTSTGGSVGEVTDELSETVDDTVDNLGDVVDGVGGTVGGLLGR